MLSRGRDREAAAAVQGPGLFPEDCSSCHDIAQAQSYRLKHVENFANPQVGVRHPTSLSGSASDLQPQHAGSDTDSSSASSKSPNGSNAEPSTCSPSCKWVAIAQYWEKCTEAESLAHANTFCEFSQILATATKSERKLHFLERELAALKDRYSAQWKVVNENSARGQYAIESFKVNLLRKQKESYEEQVRQYEAQIKTLQDSRAQYKTRFEKAQASWTLAEARAKELDDRNKVIQKKNDSCVDAIEKLIREIQAYEDKASVESKAIYEEQSNQVAEIQALTSAKESLDVENEDLRRRLEHAAKDFGTLEKRLQKADNLNESLHAEKEDLSRRLNHAESDLRATSQALAKAEDMNSTAEMQYQTLGDDHTIEMNCVGKVIDGKSAEIATLKSDIQMAEDRAVKYGKMYEEALGNLEVAGLQHENAEQRIKVLSRKVEELNNIVDNFGKQSNSYQTTIATKVVENSRLAAKLADKSAELEQHKRMINEMRHENQDQINQHSALWNAHVDQVHIDYSILLNTEKNAAESLEAEIQTVNMRLAQAAAAYQEQSTVRASLEEENEKLSCCLAEEVLKTLHLEDLVQVKEAQNHELMLDLMAQEEENAINSQRLVSEMAKERAETQKWFGVEALDDDSSTIVCDDDTEYEETFSTDEDGILEAFDEETEFDLGTEDIFTSAERDGGYSCKAPNYECQNLELSYNESEIGQVCSDLTEDNEAQSEEGYFDDERSEVGESEMLVDSDYVADFEDALDEA